MGYPEALGGLDTTAEAGDFDAISKKVEDAIVAFPTSDSIFPSKTVILHDSPLQ